jgi:thioester reductase-like protein
VIALAKRANASLYHISTCSVSGDTMKDESKNRVFTEDDYDIGQIWEDNVYVKSKFLAEGLVFDAIKDGLDAKIFRLGRLVGRSSDGQFQINPETNAFYLTLKGLIQMGVLPEAEAATPIEVTPVDVSAKEVLLLKNSERTVFHIMNPDPPVLKDLIRAIAPDFQIVDDNRFNAIFRERLISLDMELLPIVMHNWQMLTAGDSMITVTNLITTEELSKLNFVMPDVKPEVILKHFHN